MPTFPYPPSGGVHRADLSAGVVPMLVLMLTSILEPSVAADDARRWCCMSSPFGALHVSQVYCSDGRLIKARYITRHQVSELSSLLMYEGACESWWLVCIVILSG